MRVERDRVGALDALEAPAAALGQLEEAAVGRVHVQPEPLAPRPLRSRRDRPRRRCSSCRHSRRPRTAAALPHAPPRPPGRARPGRAGAPASSARPRRCVAEAGQRGRLRHGGVRLAGDEEHAVEEVLAEQGVPRGHERREVRERAARREDAARLCGVAEQLAEPAADGHFELGARGRGLPDRREAVRHPADQVAERGRRQAAAGDVGEVAVPGRVVALCERGLEQREHVRQRAPVLGDRPAQRLEHDVEPVEVGGRCRRPPFREREQLLDDGLDQFAELGRRRLEGDGTGHLRNLLRR